MAQMYEAEVGTVLTPPIAFHRQLFHTEHEAMLCETNVRQIFPDMAPIFNETVNGNFAPLQDCICRIIDITRRHL